MSGLEFDASVARTLEPMYVTPDVVKQRMRFLEVLALRPGEKVLDVGVGPGLLAYDLAATVGEGGRCAGIDQSEAMIEASRQRCADQPWTDFDVADATQLPFEAGTFDAVVSTQVYEYVPDMKQALAEVHRVLRPGGRVLILDTDWDSVVCAVSDRALHQRVMVAWDEHLHDPNLPATLGSRLREAGFEHQQVEVIPILNTARHPHTYGYGILRMIANFVVGRQGVTKDDAERWSGDLRRRGEAGDYFFAINRFLFRAVKP